jgi:hypothetical protein
MTRKQQEKFKTHTGPRQWEGTRRVPVSRKLIFLRDTRQHIIDSAEQMIEMGQEIKKAARQKNPLYMLQLQADYFVSECNKAIKSNANDDGDDYHYKGVK